MNEKSPKSEFFPKKYRTISEKYRPAKVLNSGNFHVMVVMIAQSPKLLLYYRYINSYTKVDL